MSIGSLAPLRGKQAQKTAPGEPAASRTRRSSVLRAIGRYAVVPILVAVLILAEVEDHAFFTLGSARTVLTQNASLGIIAVGLTFVLVGGGMDISVGAIYAIGSAVYTKVSLHSPLLLAFVIAMAVGVVAGLVNGVLISRFKLNAFVTTLGTASLFGGLIVVYAGPITIMPTNPGFGTFGNGTIGAVPYSIILLVVVFALGTLLLHRTSFGKALFAIGGSPEAGYLAGLRTNRFRLLTYLISGGCAALAGILYASQTGAGASNLGGATVALTGLAVVVLGGTSLFGGTGAMWRTIVGFIILSSVVTLFTVLAIGQAVQYLVEGGIVTLALVLDASAGRRAEG